MEIPKTSEPLDGKVGKGQIRTGQELCTSIGVSEPTTGPEAWQQHILPWSPVACGGTIALGTVSLSLMLAPDLTRNEAPYTWFCLINTNRLPRRGFQPQSLPIPNPN